MPCPKIAVVSEQGTASSVFFVSLSTATKMFAEGALRENIVKGHTVPDTAVFVPIEHRGRRHTDRGYDAVKVGKSSGPSVHRVSVPAEFDIVNCDGLFASDIMPCHPVRWGF
jgi:hypothetical protein